MGRKFYALLIVSSLLSMSVTTSAETLDFPMSASPASLSFKGNTNGNVSLFMDGFKRTEYINYPAIPYKVVSVLIPQGEDVAGFRMVVEESLMVDSSLKLASYNGSLRDDGQRLGLYERGEEIVGTDSEFPRWRVKHLGTGWMRGYRIASFAVYPVRYNVEKGGVSLYTKFRLVVETEPAFPLTGRIERLRYVPGFREESRRDVESLVINPEAAATYTFGDVKVENTDHAFLPSYAPSMEGSEVKYLIVTNDEMEPAFERLADWKTRKGVPTVVRTIEWIEQNYRHGADKAESIRNFLQEAYAKWGVEWVLLGGDTDVIPARYGYVTFYSGEFIPTDMYYSCLDGTWNADGDSLWGEAYHSADDPGDDADLYPDVFLGRFTVTTPDQANIMINKIINYATPLDTLSKSKFLMLAEVIFPSDYEPGDDIILDGAEIAQNLYNSYLDGNPDVTTARLYETCDQYPGSICLTKNAAIDSMNAGTNHVIDIGHGYKYNMSVGNGSILNYDANNLTNGNATFAMYLMNCTSAAFDTDCLAEYFLLNSQGGAFAVTGSSRSAFPSASRPYMDQYYHLLFDDNIVQLGKLHVLSREPFTSSAYAESADRWTHFIYNYLGDPELSIFQGRARTFSVTHPSSFSFGPNDVTVQVNSEGAPFDSALVCLYKEGDDYQYEYSDLSGIARFPEFICKSNGYVYITVTGRNRCIYRDSVLVSSASGPYLKVSKTKVQDYILGNNDGVLDAGETVKLLVKLTDTGQANASKLYAVVRSLDSSVTVTDSTSLYPDISVGAESYGVDNFGFSIDSSVEDQSSVNFRIEIHDSTGGYWYEDLALDVHAPSLELYVNQVSDSLPYGNGNGVIENGENFILRVGLKNFGSGTAYGVNAKIISNDPNISITDSTASYQDIPLLGIDYGDGFVLSESDNSANNEFTFQVVDTFGRVFEKVMELRKPLPPHNVALDASYGATQILATWQSADSLEHYRYQVYRSLQPGGPYELANQDLVFHNLFNDHGLLPSTRYYYVVTCVDSSGNESNPSAEATATTSPPQLTGWPNKMGKETASSVKIADIDGDTHPEVVVGAEYVYAWHSNGIEVRDGDNQPLTWGILNTYGNNYTATVALANLDGQPGAEVVGASWNTKEIYIFDHDGNVLPGWPKSTKYLCWASPVVGDFDGDGQQDIIAYDVGGNVYAWHVDGTELRDGDSDPATDGIFFVTGTPGSWHESTPALADIDEDNVMELIVCAPDDSIYCLNSDGSSAPGWPVYIQDAGANISASPVVGDIDGDGHLEIVVQNSAARVFGLNHDGTSMSGWPKWVYSNTSFTASCALADLTGDGRLEVVVPGMDGYCYIFKYNGSSLANWPQQYSDGSYTESSPVVADIDGDNSLDIILGCEDGTLNAWNVNGEFLPGFPIKVGSFLRGTPVVQDLDLDGDLEIATSCWDQNVYVWDLDGKYHYGYAQWNGFHGNIFNTGWKEYKGVTAVGSLAYTSKVVNGKVRLDFSVMPGITSWDLMRSSEGGAFELLASELRSSEANTIEYTDVSVEEGLTYRYKLKAHNVDNYSLETNEIDVPVAHVRLYQNHPNPFNPSTTIEFTVPGGRSDRDFVLLNIYDVSGARVKTLVSKALPGGRYEVSWDGTNEHGEHVASGIYFARLASRGIKAVRKMVLIR